MVSDWGSFFVAAVGAAAALTGLLFVGVSLNLARILALPWLPGRALESLILLLAALVASSLVLVPMRSREVLGIALLVVGLANWLTLIWVHREGWLAIAAPLRRKFVLRVLTAQATAAAYLLGGLVLTLQSEAGLYWVAGGVLGSFVVAVLGAWVLLIEINR